MLGGNRMAIYNQWKSQEQIVAPFSFDSLSVCLLKNPIAFHVIKPELAFIELAVAEEESPSAVLHVIFEQTYISN